MGKRRGNASCTADHLPFMEYSLPPIDTLCPTVHKATTSEEMRLFDLASIQLELECMLASVTERIACLTSESKGKQLPSSIIDSLRRRAANTSELETNPNGLSSLTVKANPDKPLTLIISQRNRSNQPIPAIPPLPDPMDVSRSKAPSSPSYVRRASRSLEEGSKRSPPSTDKNQACYAIPNKFWELMEPYCAEITEANIEYLESLIRSYKDIESKYFQLPPVPSGTSETVGHKKIKREPEDATDASLSYNPTLSSYNANEVQLVNEIEAELRKPLDDSSMLGKLSQVLLNSCFEENVCAELKKSVDALSHPIESPPPEELDPPPTDLTDAIICGRSAPHTFTMSQATRNLIAAKSSQPIKTLAKELQVNSSYRLEKKISQAMDELGLVPLHLKTLAVEDASATARALECDPFRIRLRVTSSNMPKLSIKSSPDEDDVKPRPGVQHHKHNLRSPVKKAIPDLSPTLVPENGRRRNSFKSDETDTSLPNGFMETSKSPTALGWRLNRRRKTRCKLPSNSTANGDDNSADSTDVLQSTTPESRLALSKSTTTTDVIPNGLLTSDEDEDVFTAHDDDATVVGGRSRGGHMSKRLRLDDSLCDSTGDRSRASPKPDDASTLFNGVDCNLVDKVDKPNAVPEFKHVDPDQLVVGSALSGFSSTHADKVVELGEQPLTPSESADPQEFVNDEVGQAILIRQQELRVICAENLGVLRRLVQAARRDMQRQEIQRRLAIADADVIEAYNKLESYRPQRKAPLKRDRDTAYKALKERRKILKELEAFDAKSP